MLVVSYTTVSPLPRGSGEPRGGLFSVALSRGSPRVAVDNHPALWSPDFPRRDPEAPPRPPDRLVRTDEGSQEAAVRRRRVANSSRVGPAAGAGRQPPA
ncbi:hypothetical protein GCM10025792_34510 [Pseudonocardia tropica]